MARSYYKVFTVSFTTLLSIFPVVLTHAQTVNNNEDFKLYCSKEAHHFDAQSPDCDRYIQERRQTNRLAPTQLSSPRPAANNLRLDLVSQKIELPVGTKIKLELAEPLSSKTAEQGDEVIYFVNEDVLSEYGEVFIKKGARATGEVTKARRSRMLGKKGILEFTVDEVVAVDGSKVPLRSTINREGKSRGGTVVALSVIFNPLFLFMKGKNINLEQGTVVSAYTDRDTSIAVTMP